MRLPSIFVTHGGGPLPVLGDAAHAQLAKAIASLPGRLRQRPRAILLCSAHFEEPHPTVIAVPPSRLLYDYGGFPPESYQLEYKPPGEPGVAEAVMHLLKGAGFKPRFENSGRGLDHGAFVPLMLMYPGADIPVVELSILSSLSPEDHVRMGAALQPLRDQGVLVVGSGSSYHNIPMIFRYMSGRLQDGKLEGQDFDDWLTEACTAHTGGERTARLAHWASAPGGRRAHPREEHLMPLLVAAAAGGDDACVAENTPLGAVAMTSYVFGETGAAP